MALRIIWTSQAKLGLDRVIDYLEEYWTAKEILRFEDNLNDLLELICEYPEICPKTKGIKNLRKGLVDKNNYIVYRINSNKQFIEIISFRGTKQD